MMAEMKESVGVYGIHKIGKCERWMVGRNEIGWLRGLGLGVLHRFSFVNLHNQSITMPPVCCAYCTKGCVGSYHNGYYGMSEPCIPWAPRVCGFMWYISHIMWGSIVCIPTIHQLYTLHLSWHLPTYSSHLPMLLRSHHHTTSYHSLHYLPCTLNHPI